MLTMNCCNNTDATRCKRPLIELCDNTSVIKLDLVACNPCERNASQLLLRKCVPDEFEIVCLDAEDVEPCCGVIDHRLSARKLKGIAAKPKPSVLYPLHEIDAAGKSVFVLDDKLKELGYGRYEAFVFVEGCDTPLEFDVEYQCGRSGIVAIETVGLLPEERC